MKKQPYLSGQTNMWVSLMIYKNKEWLKRHNKKPNKCNNCGKETNVELSFDHLLIDYTRNIKDYKWLCHNCHVKRDVNMGVYKQL